VCWSGILLDENRQGFVPLTLEQSLLSVWASILRNPIPGLKTLCSLCFCTAGETCSAQSPGFGCPPEHLMAVGLLRLTAIISVWTFISSISPELPPPRQGFPRCGCQAYRRGELQAICQHLNNFTHSECLPTTWDIFVSQNHTSQRYRPHCSYCGKGRVTLHHLKHVRSPPHWFLCEAIFAVVS
jgi:hypothetical protein